MSLTASDIQKISHLARLAIDDADIEPMANAQDATQRLREDVVTEVDHREKFQAIAPTTEAGLYLVPKVLV